MSAPAPHLPHTRPLDEAPDRAAQMLAGISAFLDRALNEADAAAAGVAPPDTAQAHDASVEAKRAELARIIGAADPRVMPADSSGVLRVHQIEAGHAADYDLFAIRWPVLGPVGGAEGIDGEGLLLEPSTPATVTIIILPDADQSPERLLSPTATQIVAAGCRVVIPQLVDRRDDYSGNPRLTMTNQPHREFVYRMAFQLGRHVIGYEVQKALALVDLFTSHTTQAISNTKVGVAGYGEGGLIALYAAALDPRIRATLISGHFRNRRHVWREPIYRNVWRLLRGFSDAELAAMIAPRTLIVDASPDPTVDGPPPPRDGRRTSAAPGTLTPAPIEDVRAEIARARRTYQALGVSEQLRLVEPTEDTSRAGLAELIHALGVPNAGGAATPSVGTRATPEHAQAPMAASDTHATPDTTTMSSTSPAASSRDTRHKRQFDQLVRYTQGLLRDSARQRDLLWDSADPSSLDTWHATTQPRRRQLWEDVIGRLPASTLPPNPRTRLAYQRSAWTGYEVTLDLHPDVFAYGILLLPADLQEGERRPVVVCQHGLEGRPQDLIEKEGRPYHQYAARLADRGYVVYAPQNPYIGRDDFRWLQRKANPLGWSLFSFIAAQHACTLEWLASLPYVDPARIAFYGLSYGGKTAMRVPALLDGSHSADGALGQPGYCLSICSGDFNEWIVKCAGTDLPMSYLFTPEWEMFEFDLGNTFNYAEMAQLIAPRPFMVERGLRDGVALDEYVAFEYAKIQRRYADLKIPDRTEIAYFDGPHEIDARATFPFLDRHLVFQPHQPRDSTPTVT